MQDIKKEIIQIIIFIEILFLSHLVFCCALNFFTKSEDDWIFVPNPSTIFIPQFVLALILAAFVGEFIYIGAATLLPETHRHPSKRIVLTTLLGIVLIIILTSLI